MESTLRLLSPRDTQPLDYAAIWPGVIYVVVFRLIRAMLRAYWITLFNFTAR